LASSHFDQIVVGGGIVGLTVTRELLRRQPRRSIAVLEKEPSLAQHQTGHNSGVIHSGVYYKPGSLKARLCLEGRREMLRYCEEHGIPHSITGKLIVATEREELPALERIYERGRANGVAGMSLIGGERISEFEPHARGRMALRVPTAGIVDYRAVAAAIADEVRGRGAEILLGRKVTGIARRTDEIVLETASESLSTKRVVACGGLQCDRLAAMSSASRDVRIIPFRGDYWVLRDSAQRFVRSMIYPVPDPRFPFLGVHFTKRIDGEVWAGPNAVLALARERYGRLRIEPGDAWKILTWPGFWRLAAHHWQVGMIELWRDFVKSAYLQQLQRYVPEIESQDLLPGPCGIRAQAVDRPGNLLDDFLILETEGVVHVLNAPSPAATAAFAIAREIADRIGE
jgi:(S)-2-hydroxyglutarate dehydrogenase